MGYCWGILRALLGVVLFWGVWFMYVTVVVDHTMTTVARTSVPHSTRRIEHLEFFLKHRFHFHQDLEIHYVSRRRVPFGPDPIHNSEEYRKSIGKRTVPLLFGWRVSKDKKPPGRS